MKPADAGPTGADAGAPDAGPPDAGPPPDLGQVNLTALAVARELPGGAFAYAPLADLARVAHGEEAEARDELLFFLGNFLPALPPEVIAGFAAPAADAAAQPQLLHLDIPLSRPDLPRRGASKLLPPLSIPCAVLPADPSQPAGDRWVLVLPLRHTLYVAARDDLEATVRAEVQRLVAAEERSPQDYLELLPALSTELVRLDLQLDLPDRLPPGRAAGLRRLLSERARRRRALEILLSVSAPLPQRLRPPTLVGRADELAQLTALLGGRERLGVLLTGPPGSGKTALFLSWQAEAVRSQRLVFCTSAAQLIAGMSGLGQWQERLRRVLDAAELLDAVLYFENLADLLSERADSPVDLPGALRPYVAAGRVRVCGELPDGAVDPARHVGFFLSLSRLHVPELSAAQAHEALLARAQQDRRRGDRRAGLLPDGVAAVMDLSARYLPYSAFPGKAVRLYDEILGVCDKLPPDPRGATQLLVGAEQVLSIFSRHHGVPALLLRPDQPLRLDDVTAALRRRVIGQEAAVRHVAQTLCRVKAGLQPTGRPLCTFLFAGPTGVGKTELARALCAYLFGTPAQPAGQMVRFDMSEFTGPEAAERLIRGDSGDGLLTRRVREQPFCVVLLDEIEKAHPQVFDLLLQVLGEGRLTDGRGRTASFANAIVILTSNLGAGGPQRGAGFAAPGESQEAHYLRAVQRAFRPEFIGRLDRVIPFAALSPDEVAQVAALQVRRLGERRGLRDRGVSLTVTPAALSHLGAAGYDPSLGARQLRRCLEDQLVAPLSRLLSQMGAAARGGHARVSLRGEASGPAAPLQQREAGALVLAVYPATAGAAGAVRSVGDLSALRRQGDRLLALDRVQEVRDRVELLTAQLTQLARGRRRAAAAGLSQPEVGPLQAELDRLQRLWRAAQAAQAALRESEELALTVALSGDDPAPLLADAERAYGELRRQLLRLLCALEPRRDSVALLVQELDDRQALSQWLSGLLAVAPRWGWQVTLCLDGDADPADAAAGAGAGRRLGPARSADDGWERLQRQSGRQSVLVLVNGPDAAMVLGLEAGRVRFTGADEAAELHCALCAFRTTFTDAEWRGPALTPQPLAQRAASLPLSRVIDAAQDEVTLGAVREPKIPLRGGRYFDRLAEVALHQLLLCEERFGARLSRDNLYVRRLPDVPLPDKAD